MGFLELRPQRNMGEPLPQWPSRVSHLYTSLNSTSSNSAKLPLSVSTIMWLFTTSAPSHQISVVIPCILLSFQTYGGGFPTDLNSLIDPRKLTDIQFVQFFLVIR